MLFSGPISRQEVHLCIVYTLFCCARNFKRRVHGPENGGGWGLKGLLLSLLVVVRHPL